MKRRTLLSAADVVACCTGAVVGLAVAMVVVEAVLRRKAASA